jgi:hypothetical protein
MTSVDELIALGGATRPVGWFAGAVELSVLCVPVGKVPGVG